MKVVRRLGGGLVWVVASVLGLVSVLLCLTVILLPLGLPLLLLTRRLFRVAIRLWAPRAVSHPVDELAKQSRKAGRSARNRVPMPPKWNAPSTTQKSLRRGVRRARKRLHGQRGLGRR